jgi:hypothetical protein
LPKSVRRSSITALDETMKVNSAHPDWPGPHEPGVAPVGEPRSLVAAEGVERLPEPAGDLDVGVGAVPHGDVVHQARDIASTRRHGPPPYQSNSASTPQLCPMNSAQKASSGRISRA